MIQQPKDEGASPSNSVSLTPETDPLAGVPSEAISTFKITIWKLMGKDGDSLGSNSVVSSVRFQISEPVKPLMNKLFFSQDGKYIFIILVGT